MRKKKLLWQLYSTYFLITLISLVAFIWYISDMFRNFYLEQAASQLKDKAQLVREQVMPYLNNQQADQVDELSKKLGNLSSTRITIVLPTGKVIGDTERPPQTMDNHATRPEIEAALKGEAKTTIRFSKTLQQEMMYVAIPIQSGNVIHGIIRTALPINSVSVALSGIRVKVFIGWLVVLFIAAFSNLLISRMISRPLAEIKEGTQAFAKGNLEQRLVVPESEELGDLVEALNHMAAQLDDRIKTVSRQNHVQEAILASMTESLLAVDSSQHLINLNHSAADLFHLDPETAKGRHLSEVVRNSEIQGFIQKMLQNHTPLETELIIYNDSKRVLQVHGTALHDIEGKSMGALVVFNDITQIRRLEQMRQDFVANVSHELKTPITSIKGAAETLKDGAYADPGSAQRFLTMITRHADRLGGIIEDLLTLSRIEQDPEKAFLSFEEMELLPTLKLAMQLCESKAQEKNIQLSLKADASIRFPFNASLLEQGIINLVDNAIKYSEPYTMVEIETELTETEIIIYVHDQGVGIAKHQLPRLFERFYRVDKARSRNLGGTGLGLAIVKHIAQAHQGHVSVTSTLGQGSTFSIHIPLTS